MRTRCSGLSGVFFLLADLGQFPGIEPITSTVRTFIDLDPALRAEEMFFQLDAVAFRAGTLPRHVHLNLRVLADMEHSFTRGFGLIVHALQFEGIEPDAATPILAHVDSDVANLKRSKLIETSRTLHGTMTFALGRECVKPEMRAQW
jgi:hypothetical protein